MSKFVSDRKNILHILTYYWPTLHAICNSSGVKVTPQPVDALDRAWQRRIKIGSDWLPVPVPHTLQLCGRGNMLDNAGTYGKLSVFFFETISGCFSRSTSEEHTYTGEISAQ